MKSEYVIFSIKPTEFTQGKSDPFRFDSFTEKISDKYLPFSGTVRKPVYFLAVQYVECLLASYFPKNLKKEETEIRLEKLMVSCWKRNRNIALGKHIIGSSRQAINPFRGDDGTWVVQTCFRIYSKSVSRVLSNETLLDAYCKHNPEEPAILLKFLERSGPLTTESKNILDQLIQKLQKRRNSLFATAGKLPVIYVRRFRESLKEAIKYNNAGYFRDIEPYLQVHKPVSILLQEKILGNEKKYPFRALNNWFASFIRTVDSNMHKGGAMTNWREADSLFEKIPAEFRNKLNRRPEPRSWFEKTGDRYIPLIGNDFDEYGWDALVRRAYNQNLYDFRITALASLLDDLL